MSTNLGGVESSMRIFLEGVDEAKKQFSDLRKDAKSIEHVKGKVELDVQKIDVDGLVKQVKSAEREIKASLNRALKTDVDFSKIRSAIQKELGPIDASRMLGPIEDQLKRTKTLMQDALGGIKELSNQAKTSLGSVGGAMFTAQDAARITNNLQSVKSNFDGMVTGAKSVIAEFKREVDSINASGGKLATDTLKQQRNQITLPTIDTTKSTASVDALTASFGALSQKTQELHGTAAPVSTDLGRISAEGLKAAQSMDALAGKMDKAEQEAKGASTSFVAFEHVAQGLGGRMSKMFDIGAGKMSSEVNEVIKSLRAAGADQNVFKELFSPAIMQKVQALDAAFKELAKARAGIEEAGANPSKGSLNAFVEAQQKVLRIREEIANSSLRLNAGMGGAKDGASIEAMELSISQIERYKSSVERTLSLLNRKNDVLKGEEVLQNSIVGIVKAGGDAEINVLSRRRSNLDVMQQLTQYAENLLRAEEKLSKLPQTSSTLAMRRDLAATAAQSYSAASLGAPAGDVSVDSVMRKAVDARKIVETVDAQKAFRMAVLDSVGAVEMGLAPAVDKVTASIAKYQALSHNAFAASTGDIQTLLIYIKTMQTEVAKLQGKGTLTSNKQASSILNSMQAVASAAMGSSNPNVDKEGLAVIRDRIKLDQEALALTIARQGATQKINEDLAKLLLYQQAGVNVTASMTKMQDMYVQALKQGLTVEEQLATATTNKGAALRNIYQEYLRVNALAKDATLTEAQQLEMRKAAIDLLRMAVPLQRELGSSVNVSGKKVSADTLQGNLKDSQLDVAARERVLALAGQLKGADSSVNELLVSRKKLENDIINSLVRANDLTQAGLGSRALYEEAIKARITAERQGLDISQQQLNYDLLQQQALSGLVNEERVLAGIIDNENAAHFVRNTAAKQYLETIRQIRSIVGDKSTTVGSTTVDKSYLAAADSRYNRYTGKETDKPPPATIADVANLTLTQAQVTEKTAQQGTKLAESMKKAKEEILAGVNVLENYARLQQLIVQTAQQGVNVDASTLGMLVNQERVLKSIAETTQKIIETGRNSSDPGVKARAFTMGTQHLNALSGMASPDQMNAFGGESMRKSLEELRTAAGTALAGSMRAAREEADKLYATLGRVNLSVQEISRPASKGSFDAHRNNLERMLPLIEQILQKERNITQLEEFRTSTSDAEMNAQYRKIASLERIKTLIAQIRSEQNKFAANAGRLGLTDEQAYTATPSARRAAVAAADANKDPKAYLAMTESMKNIASYNAELARTAKESGIVAINTERMQRALQGSSGPAKDVANNLGLSAKQQASKASSEAGQDMFDPNRMAWFMQLRMFWSTFTNIQQTMMQAVEFAHTLNVVRSVAQTTAGELKLINAEFDRLSTVVPIAYNAMAQAVLEVAKAGFTAEESLKIVSNSAKLAQATGDDLKRVADLQTVIIHAWGLGAEHSEKISDQLYNAVAKSRADIKGLDSALGYVAGIAPQANVSVGETLSMMGILSNAGLAMSKSGTYMRQFLNDLMNPSEKLVGILNKLGVSVSDVNPRFHKISDIFKLLAARGMDMTQAFDGMSIRAASAFSVLLKNSDTLESFTDAVDKSGTVNEAYQHTIKDFSSSMAFFQNQMVQTANTWGTLFGPMVANIMQTLGKGVILFNKLGKAVTDSTSTVGKGVSELVSTTIQLVLGLYTLQKISVMLTTTVNKLGLGTYGVVRAFNALKFATLGWIGLIAGGAAAAFAMWAHSNETAADVARKSIEGATEAAEEFRNAADKAVQLKLEVTTDKTLRDNTAAAQKVAEEAGVKTMGGRAVNRTAQDNLIAEYMGSGDDAKIAAAEAARGFLVEVNMDFDAAEIAMKQFFDIMNKASEDSAKKLSDELVKGIETAAAKADKLLNKVTDDLAHLEALSKKGTKSFGFTSIEGAKNEYNELARTTSGLISGDFHMSGVSVISANMQSDMHALVQEFEDGLFTDGLKADTKELSIFESKLRDTFARYHIETAKLDVIRNEQNLEKRRDMYKQEVVSLRDEAAKSKQHIVPNPSMDNVSTWGSTNESVAMFIHSQNLLKEAKAAGDFEAGDPKAIARLTDIIAKLDEAVQAYTASGRTNNTSYGVMSQLETMKSYLTSRFPAQKKAQEKTETALKEVKEPGVATSQAVGRQVNTQVKRVEENLKSFSTLSASSGTTGKMLQVMPTADGLARYSDNIDKMKAGLQEIIGQVKALDGVAGFESLSLENQQKAMEGIKNLFDSVEIEKDALGIEKSIQRLIETARELTETTEGFNLNPSAILKMKEAGKEAHNIVKNIGGGDLGDSLETMVTKSIKQWQAASAATKEKGFFEYHQKIREEVMKTYKTLSKVRADLSKNIRKNSESITEYAAAVESLMSVRQVLKDVSADSVAMAEATNKVTALSGDLRKVSSALEDTRDIARETTGIMDLFAGQTSIPMEVVNQMGTFADAARGNMESATKSAEDLKAEVISLTSELLKLNLEAKKGDAEFLTSLRAADQAAYRNPLNAYSIDQSNLNFQRKNLGDMAGSMSTEELKGELKGLQSSLLDFYKQYTNTEAGRAARAEALNIQGDLNALNSAMKARVEAELSMKIAYYNDVTTMLAQIRDTLVSVSGSLANVRAQAIEQMSDGAFRGSLAQSSGSKGPRYEPASVPKEAWQLMFMSEGGRLRGNSTAIGHDKGGGTSYGAGQIASKLGNMDAFVKMMEQIAPDIATTLKTELVKHLPRTASGDLQSYDASKWNTGTTKGAGPEAWLATANKFGDKFLDAQLAYLDKTHVQVTSRKIEEQSGVEVSKLSAALQGVIVAASINNGPAGGATQFMKAFQALGSDKAKVDTPAFIEKMYELRNNPNNYKTAGAQTYNGVRQNLNREKQNALNMWNEQQRNPAAFKQADPLKTAVKDGVVAGMEAAGAGTALPRIGEVRPGSEVAKTAAPVQVSEDRKVTPATPEVLPRIGAPQGAGPLGVTPDMPVEQAIEVGMTNALTKATAATGGKTTTAKDDILFLMNSLTESVPNDMKALMTAIIEKIKAASAEGAEEIAGMVFDAFEKPTKGEISAELNNVAESLMLVSDKAGMADTAIGKFAGGVGDLAGTQLAAATDKYKAAQEQENAAKKRVAAAEAKQKEIDKKEQYLMPKDALTSYSQTWEKPNDATQRTFNSLADNIHTGLSSAIMAALQSVGQEDGDWYEAASAAIEQMTWQMIDTWIQTQMKMLSQAAWQQVGAFSGATDPTTGQTMEADWAQFGHWWGADTKNDFQQPQVADLVNQPGAYTIPGVDAGGLDAAAQALQQGVAADAQNIAGDAMNIATEQTMQAAQQTMQTSEQTMQMTAQTTDQTFAQAVLALQSGVIPGLQAAATALQQAASSIMSAAQSGAAAGAAGAGGGGFGGLSGAAANKGGLIGALVKAGMPGFAFGGLVMGGNKQADSTLVAATKGEFMVQEPAVRRFGSEFFKKLNAGNAQQAFESLAFPSPALQGVDHAVPDSARQSSGGSGQVGRRDSRPEGLKIMNIMDPRMMDAYMASPRGRKVVQNLALQGIGKIKK